MFMPFAFHLLILIVMLPLALMLLRFLVVVAAFFFTVILPIALVIWIAVKVLRVLSSASKK